MKRVVVLFLFAMVIVSVYSCRKVVGEGPVVVETRSVGNFTGINLGVPGELTYSQNSVTGIEIQAQQNIIDVIETYVSNNELKIRVRENRNIRSHEHIRIIVGGPSVSSLVVSGSGSINVHNPFTPLNARMVVSGSGRMIIHDLVANTADVNVSGSGDIQVLAGTVGYEDLVVSGSGHIDLLNVTAGEATTNTSGSGTIKLHVTDELNSRISGSGSVFYKGNPEVNSTISGSGRLVKL